MFLSALPIRPFCTCTSVLRIITGTVLLRTLAFLYTCTVYCMNTPNTYHIRKMHSTGYTISDSVGQISEHMFIYGNMINTLKYN